MKIKVERINTSLFVICFFLISLPFYVWSSAIIRHIAEFVCLCLFFTYSLKVLSVDIKHRGLIVFFFLFVLYISLRNISTISVKVFLNIALVSIFFIPDKNKIKFYEAYKTFISIFLFISILVYIAVLWLNIDIPYSNIDALNNLKPGGYRAYPFLAVYDSEYAFVKYRFCGPYDEPGVIGTFAIILLYGERYNLKDYRNIIIFISGICSFSMFFFVMTALYFLIFNGKYFISIIFFTLGILLLYIGRENEIISSLVFDRFEIYKNGGGRTTDFFNNVYSEFIKTPDLIWGEGTEKTSKLLMQTGASSYKSVIYEYGLIGLFLYLLLWGYHAISNLCNKNNIVIFCFLFGAVFYQRPSLFEPYYYFLFSVIISKYSFYEKPINNDYSCYL